MGSCKSKKGRLCAMNGKGRGNIRANSKRKKRDKQEEQKAFFDHLKHIESLSTPTINILEGK